MSEHEDSANAKPELAVLLRHSDTMTSQSTGRLTFNNSEIAVVEVTPPNAIRAGDRFVLIAGEPGNRRFTNAVCRFAKARTVVAETMAAFQQLNRRADARYPAAHTVRLTGRTGRPEAGEPELAGTLIDVGEGGASIAVAAEPNDREIFLVIAGAADVPLPGLVVSTRPGDSGVVLGVQFDKLTALERDAVENLIGIARANS